MSGRRPPGGKIAAGPGYADMQKWGSGDYGSDVAPEGRGNTEEPRPGGLPEEFLPAIMPTPPSSPPSTPRLSLPSTTSSTPPSTPRSGSSRSPYRAPEDIESSFDPRWRPPYTFTLIEYNDKDGDFLAKVLWEVQPEYTASYGERTGHPDRASLVAITPTAFYIRR
ncbi:hypothetical protein DL771_009390 [Monosporascus sp. 5C6A]|nr:hypothetical protein DL771_009390 [Monosporascus sp. 5C6A]